MEQCFLSLWSARFASKFHPNTTHLGKGKKKKRKIPQLCCVLLKKQTNKGKPKMWVRIFFSFSFLVKFLVLAQFRFAVTSGMKNKFAANKGGRPPPRESSPAVMSSRRRGKSGVRRVPSQQGTSWRVIEIALTFHYPVSRHSRQ